MPLRSIPEDSSDKLNRSETKFDGDPDAPPKPLADPTAGNRGTILDRWNISIEELTDLVDENPSLRGIMLGYAAEHKFREFVQDHPHISGTKKYDDHDRKRKSDRVITYKGEDFSIEVKSLQTNSVQKIAGGWKGRAQVDGSDRRVIDFPDGSQLNTTLLLRGHFDILAVNCFAFENKWRFVFALNRNLPISTWRKYTEAQRLQLIASLVPVTWPPEPPFVADPFPLVEALYLERRRSL